ncbi:hypothetical protein K3727_18665 [Rhodobacteraceae bacterium M382]|nr:hypothetical protein K3727_18665 [Rhodobacteraceae bacterium M382]
MDLLLFFLPGPVVFVVMAFFPKSRGLGVGAVLAAFGVVALHESLPAIIGSDAAGNGMASGFRAIGFYSLASGLLFAGGYMLIHRQWRLDDRPWVVRGLVFVAGLIGAAAFFLLLVG